MKAIQTKYRDPSKVYRARVTATSQAGTSTVNYNHELPFEQNHAAAAQALATRMGWTGPWIGGGLPDDTFVWVHAADPTKTFSVTPKEQTR